MKEKKFIVMHNRFKKVRLFPEPSKKLMMTHLLRGSTIISFKSLVKSTTSKLVTNKMHLMLLKKLEGDIFLSMIAPIIMSSFIKGTLL